MASLRHRYDQVFRFKVAVYDIIIVQIFNCKEDLGNIVWHVLLHLAIVLSYLAQQRASLYILQLKVQVLLILKRTEYAHQERAFRYKHITPFPLIDGLLLKLFVLVDKELKHFSLRNDMVDMLHLGDAFFLQYLDGTHSFVTVVVCFVDFAEVADADYLLEVEICYFWPVCFDVGYLLGMVGTTRTVSYCGFNLLQLGSAP